MVNKHKSCFLLGPKSPSYRAGIVAEVTGYVPKYFLLKY